MITCRLVYWIWNIIHKKNPQIFSFHLRLNDAGLEVIYKDKSGISDSWNWTSSRDNSVFLFSSPDKNYAQEPSPHVDGTTSKNWSFLFYHQKNKEPQQGISLCSLVKKRKNNKKQLALLSFGIFMLEIFQEF